MKSAGGLGVLTLGLGTSTDLAAADPSKFERGTVQFVEVKEEFPNAPTGPKSARHGTAGYVVEPSKKRLTLTNAPVDTFTGDSGVVAADGEFYESGTSFPITKSRYQIPVETDYRGLTNEYVGLGRKRSVPKASLVEANGAVRLATGGDEMRVPEGQEAEFEDRTVSVTPANGERPVSARQRITVRNHGQVTLYAHEDYMVFPLASNDPYARARVQSLLALAQDQLSKIDEADLLAVPKDVQVETNANGGA
ncbi:hypothetical protein [Halorussus caseinilyticus]|uniref:hypothetical protein n=1 Tax=Halorussus caseinilyticus TaxID=3034025 RepID=UPI0023E7656E|nr:hypothetical protein [Halorussus sp. DT72]